MNKICLRYDCLYRTVSGYCGRTAGCIDEVGHTQVSAQKPKFPKLKQCPFCGGKYSLRAVEHPQEGFGSRYSILCDYREGGCGADGPWYHSPEEAAWAWNQRA